jgi:DNA topoisomerase I
MATTKKKAAKKAAPKKSPATTAAAKKPAVKRPAAKAPARKAAAKRPAAARGVVASEPELPHDEDAARAAAGKSLVIVESPAKAKTIGKYLGSGYAVKATVGHIRDLPAKKQKGEKGPVVGIDIEHGFEPRYITIPGKEKTVAELKSAAKTAKAVYIATDPDREGEAIAWHVEELIKGRNAPPIKRALFYEITKDAVGKALDAASEIDHDKVDAQQARRVLDRVVGFSTSPVLWKTVKKGLSAGRVQTVALRLLVEREREIRAFVPREYWTIAAQLEHEGQGFTAKLHHLDGEKPDIADAAAAQRILDDLKGRTHFDVTDIKRRERRKNPEAPFKTSTLQQEAAKKLGFGSKRTMRLAQNLYEGCSSPAPKGRWGSSPTCAPTTCAWRTPRRRRRGSISAGSSPRSSSPTDRGCFRRGRATPRRARTRASGPPIPRARRTASPGTCRPSSSSSTRSSGSASWPQMAPAVFDTTTVDFDLGRYLFRATGSVVKFKGFLALYKETREEGDSKALEDEQALPAIEPGRARARAVDRSHAALHRAAAALLRGVAREGAGEAGHRPAVHVRVDHLHAHGAALRRAQAAALLPHRARRERREGDGEAVPARVRRRLHRRNGGRARQGGGG